MHATPVLFVCVVLVPVLVAEREAPLLPSRGLLHGSIHPLHHGLKLKADKSNVSPFSCFLQPKRLRRHGHRRRASGRPGPVP